MAGPQDRVKEEVEQLQRIQNTKRHFHIQQELGTDNAHVWASLVIAEELTRIRQVLEQLRDDGRMRDKKR